MQLVATAVLFVGMYYSIARALHWYELWPLAPDNSGHWRAAAWGLVALVCVLLMHPIWMATR